MFNRTTSRNFLAPSTLSSQRPHPSRLFHYQFFPWRPLCSLRETESNPIFPLSRLFKYLRLALFVIAVLLTGCSIGPPERSPPHIFVLSPEISVNNLAANPGDSHAAILLVSLPKPLAGYDTPQMVYVRRQHEVSYYAANQWADTPARMLAPLMVQAMRNTGLWQSVVQAPSTVRADYRLDCDGLVLEQQFFSNPSRVRLALRAQLIDLQAQRIIDSHNFEIFESAPSDDPYGGVVAANRAAGKLLAEMPEWLDTIVRATK